MDKKISCILPTYNGSEFLEKSVDSVINQTYQNWELIIVNDCSTDKTEEIVKNFLAKDKRIKYIKNLTNCKLPKSLNIGFEQATGDYYTWTSDDNEYYPEAFERMVAFLEEKQDFGMVYCETNVAENGILQNDIWCDRKTTPVSLLEICVPGACFMYRAEIAKEVGKYNEEMFLNEDHEYWLRMLLKTKIGNIQEVLYLYNLRDGSLTGTRKHKISQGKIKLLRKYRKIYAESFPEIKEIYKKEFYFDDLIENKISLKQAKKILSKKELYKFLKKEYKVNENPKSLDLILKLGIIYFCKGIKLFLVHKIRCVKEVENV